MKDDERYMVFRVPSYKEQVTDGATPYLWGWTLSKSVIKVFKQQRDQSKYNIIRMSDKEIAEEFSENDIMEENMIDYIELGDVESGEMVPFFTTRIEMQEAEIKIQRMMSEYCSFSRLNEDPTPYVNIMMNLSEYYQEILEFIGYCPKEMTELFDSNIYDPGDIDAIDDRIIDGYNEYQHDHKVPGSHTLDKLANKVIYSLQSFMAVLKNDL